MNKRILIVEDDNDINSMLQTALLQAGYDCVGAYSGTEALLRIQADEYSLIILDLMLPGMDGQNVLKQLRDSSEVPVIVLSAKDELDTKVDLLMLGANDYMTKPFELPELVARVKVQLRKSIHINNDGEKLTYRELFWDTDSKTLYVNDNIVSLTAQEGKIMELFLKHPGKVFSKNEIYQYAWDEYYMGEDKTIYVHISNIRQKLKQYTDEDYIETVWGLGFKL